MKLTDTQASVVELLGQHMSPPQIADRLGMTRQGVHEVMKRITSLGILRLPGDLPRGARATTYPDRSASVWQETLPEAGWRPDELARIRRDESLAGIVPPMNIPAVGSWSGQAFRRVDWTFGHRWCVQAALVLQPDGTQPAVRSVIVHRDLKLTGSGLFDRGGVITADNAMRAVVVDVTIDEMVGLGLAVAWVLESRALLDVDVLRATTVLGGS